MAVKVHTLASLLDEGLGGDVSQECEGDVSVICPSNEHELERRLSRSQLWCLAKSVGARLVQQATTAGDTSRRPVVALALENGLNMVLSLIGCFSTSAVAAPLNPAYTESEFRFYLQDLSASLLVLPEESVNDSSHPAVRAAKHLGIFVCSVDLKDGIASGSYTFIPQPDNVALLLHTSGTTGKPKCVPLTQENLASSALNVATGYALCSVDRGYLVQVLFHIHGIVAGLLAPLISGGSLVITPRFNGQRAFQDLREYQCTWLSGTPSALQMLLAAARGSPSSPIPRLRFIRSCSSPLLPTTFKALQLAYGCPIVEAYAMTENAHQITTNDLSEQLAGSVGKPFGTISMAIFTPLPAPPTLLAPNCFGEVCISGPTVTTGYLNNSKANQEAFFTDNNQHWFRTGDRGRLDHKRNLHLAGRYSEIINRGGEKISPPEVDEALMLSSSAVREAACFAVPDAFWGQEVEAAVVLDERASMTAEKLQTLLQDFLATHKIPKRIHICQNSIPKGPTGKIQRNVLSSRFAKDRIRSQSVLSRVEETAIISALAKCLKTTADAIDRQLTLQQLGVDSLVLTALVMECARLGCGVTIADLLGNVTVEQLVRICQEKAVLAGPKESERSEPFELIQKEGPALAALLSDVSAQLKLHVDDIEDVLPLTEMQVLCISRTQDRQYCDTNLEWLLVGGRIRQSIDTAKLRRAFQLSMRYETQLRTYFVQLTESTAWVQVHESHRSAQLAWHEICGATKAETDARLSAFLSALRHRSGTRAFFCVLVRHSQGEKEFYLITSHIITDTVSRAAHLNHVVTLYDGESAVVPEQLLPVPWANFVKGKRATLQAARPYIYMEKSDRASHFALSSTSIHTKRHENFWSGPIMALSNKLAVSIPMLLHCTLPLAIALFETQLDGHARTIPADVRFCVYLSDRASGLWGADRIRGLKILYKAYRMDLSGQSISLLTLLKQACQLFSTQGDDFGMSDEEQESARRYVTFNWRELDSTAAWADRIADGHQTSSYASPTRNAIYAGRVGSDQISIYAAENALYQEYCQQQGQGIGLVDMIKRVLSYLCANGDTLDTRCLEGMRNAILVV